MSTRDPTTAAGQPYRSMVWRWDTPWVWSLGQQVGVLAAGVGVALAACISSLWPEWEQLLELQQTHQVLLAQRQTSEQLVKELPELERQVQALREAHAKRSPPAVPGPTAWRLPVAWSPVLGVATPGVVGRWRGVTQGPASALAAVLSQLALGTPPLQVELVRIDPTGHWRLSWEVPGVSPPGGPSTGNRQAADWGNLLEEQAMLAHWREQLLKQPGRLQWLAPELRRPQEALEAFELSQMVWVGWLQQGEHRVAVVQAGHTFHRVGVGAHMGRQHGRVQHIGDDHLILRQVQRNAQGEWGAQPLRWPPDTTTQVPGTATPTKTKARP